MKVIDPQSAILTTAEVHHFLKTNPPRNPDKRIGAYKTVDLKNYSQVRKDVCFYPFHLIFAFDSDKSEWEFWILLRSYIHYQHVPPEKEQIMTLTSEASNPIFCTTKHYLRVWVRVAFATEHKLTNSLPQVDHYLLTTTPYILQYPAPETWASRLTSQLKPYGLTKTEVLSLANLGIGLDRGNLDSNDQVNGNGHVEDADHGEIEMQDPVEEQDGHDDEHEESMDANEVDETNDHEVTPGEEPQEGEGESNYDRHVLSLIIDEIDTRFPGDEGEEKLQKILNVVRECIVLESRAGNGGAINAPENGQTGDENENGS